VSYRINNQGKFLGIGDRLVPVPASVFHKGSFNNLMLNVNKKQIETAPNFALKSRPNFDDQAYDPKVDGYYGASQ
jgi:hypothetical protein